MNSWDLLERRKGKMKQSTYSELKIGTVKMVMVLKNMEPLKIH